MKIIILLLLFLQKCLTFDIRRNECKTDLTIDKNHYNISQIYQVGDTEPTDAHYDSHGNLFFVVFGRNYNGYYFDIKLIKPNTTTPQIIPGLPERESYSVAVDKKNEKVYFGTSGGIYAYNYKDEDANLILKPDIRLNTLLVDKNGNKYVTGTQKSDDNEQMYLLVGDKKIPIEGFEGNNEVAIDDKTNFYYIKEEKLFVLKSNLTASIFIGNVSYEGLAQINFHEENVYIASETLSYIHENDTGPLKVIKNIPGNVTAIAFDESGNFVVGIKGKLLKYVTKQNECRE